MPAGVPTAIENNPIMPPEKPWTSVRYRFWKKLAGAMKMLPMKATADSSSSRRRFIRGRCEWVVMWAATNRRVSGSRRARSRATTHHTNDTT